jgi:hypothetical protein
LIVPKLIEVLGRMGFHLSGQLSKLLNFGIQSNQKFYGCKSEWESNSTYYDIFIP